jgi:hypothetical protein
LTIPYIYGAYEILGKPFQDIEALIEHIISFDIDKYAALGMCDILHHEVLADYSKGECNVLVRHYQIINLESVVESCPHRVLYRHDKRLYHHLVLPI